MTEAEQRALELSFQNSFNSLTFYGCDGLFRVIAEVKLTIGTFGQTFTSRRMQEVDGGNSTMSSNFTNATATFGPAVFSVRVSSRLLQINNESSRVSNANQTLALVYEL